MHSNAKATAETETGLGKPNSRYQLSLASGEDTRSLRGLSSLVYAKHSRAHVHTPFTKYSLGTKLGMTKFPCRRDAALGSGHDLTTNILPVTHAFVSAVITDNISFANISPYSSECAQKRAALKAPMPGPLPGARREIREAVDDCPRPALRLSPSRRGAARP